MATKLKKRKPFATFAVFFLALNILFGAFIAAAYILVNNSGTLAQDYKESWSYRKGTVARRLIGESYALITGDPSVGEYRPEDGRWFGTEGLTQEGNNLSYLLLFRGEPVAGNTGVQTVADFQAMAKAGLADSWNAYDRFSVRASDQGYDHMLVIRGGEYYEIMNTRHGQVESTGQLRTSRYASTGLLPDQMLSGLENEWQDITLCFAVNAEGKLGNNNGSIYTSYYFWYWTMAALLCASIAACVALILLVVVFIKRHSLEIAKAKIASFTGWFWVEVKAVCLFLALGITFGVLSYDASGIFLLIPLFWALWLLWNDLKCNRRGVFSHNILSSITHFFKNLESKYAFCARMKRRLVYLILEEMFLMGLCLLLIPIFEGFALFIDLFLVGIGIVLLVQYINAYNRNIDAFAAIMDYAGHIREGTANGPLQLSQKDSDFAPLAADLSDIHSGMVRMVDDRVRSEKMKVELITNVSHDLKTPLTSIINYVDLLSKEHLEPEFTNDYVKILVGKSERLKNLVQDLFEIAKANSGAIDLNLEQINILSLVEQTVAEMDERSRRVGVDVKLQLCEMPLIVRADGKKLHRVLENLLGNALKYSLAGTRVYVSAQQEGQNAVIAFKNVSSYEMNFTAEEIVERFQRGDTSRTSEGSGLGLAIAKSFLELNGGSLGIELEGDLFKAIVTMPLYVPYAQRSEEEQEAAPQGTPSGFIPVEQSSSGFHPVSAAEAETPVSLKKVEAPEEPGYQTCDSAWDGEEEASGTEKAHEADTASPEVPAPSELPEGAGKQAVGCNFVLLPTETRE